MAAIFGSAAFGLLLGMLLGLSASPTVAIVVTSVAALLGTLLGLKGRAKDEEKTAPIRFGIVGCFSIACVAGVVGGIAMRTHNALSPSVIKTKQRWEAAGFTPDEAKRLVVLELLNTSMPASDKSDDEKKAAASTRTTVLFSNRSDSCTRLRAGTFPDGAKLLEALAREAKDEKGKAGAPPLSWQGVIEELRSVPADKQLAAGTRLFETLCFVDGMKPRPAMAEAAGGR